MDILYVTSEAAPFCKTGGLADVLGSLPPAVAAGGDRAAVILPLYGQVSDAWREKMRWHGYTYVDLAWRHEYCGLFSLEYRGVVWYFLDNERYFRRGALYGQMDDGERFAFFSKAVVSVLPMLEWRPEVIHCNDWQTALVPIYLKTVAENVSTVFTIHNIEYQGKYGADTVEDLFGLNRGDWYESGVLQMDGCVNLMKGAMVTADAVTTVSPTYAAQLRESAYAAGLDSVVRSIQWKFSGVLNGIDMVSYDPECDPDLPARYTAAEPEGKTLCKAALQQELGLAQEEGTPVLSMVTRLVGHKGVDLVCQALDGIMATGCQLVVLGSGDGGYENCGLSQMIAMRYGAVPIVRQTGGLNDTVRSCQVGQPDGNGYVFAAYDAGAMLDTIGQAVGLYHGDAEGFRMVRRRGMEGDFSWDRSAGAYRNIYGKLLGR